MYRLAAMFSTFAVAAVPPTPAADDKGHEFAWVSDIIRPAFLLRSSESGTYLWKVSPKLAVKKGTKKQQEMVAEVVKEFNEMHGATPIKRIEILPPEHSKATLSVEFLPRRDIPARCKALGAPDKEVEVLRKAQPKAHAMQRRSATEQWTLAGGRVFVASDEEDLEALKLQVVRSLCFDLGLAGVSGRRADSVFYGGGEKPWTATGLSAADKKFIVWYYNFVPAGTKDPAEIEKLYKAHWPKDEPGQDEAKKPAPK